MTSESFPPAATPAARALLCLFVIAGQALTLLPGYIVALLCIGSGQWAAGLTGAVIGGVLTILFFAMMTYGVTWLATILAGRALKTPTFFSPSFIARRTTIGFCAGLSALLVAAVAEQLLRRPGSARNSPWETVVAVLMIVFVVLCSSLATWSSSKRHSDSL